MNERYLTSLADEIRDFLPWNASPEEIDVLLAKAEQALRFAAKPAPAPRCQRCDGDQFISVHENLPDEPCPVCNSSAPSGAERVRTSAALSASPADALPADGVREAYSALCEPRESQASDNLESALYDIERYSADGKPTDAVCIRTIRRVLKQLVRAEKALSSQNEAGGKLSEATPEADDAAVAWQYEVEFGDSWARHLTFHKPQGNNWQRNIIPLFTHPATTVDAEAIARIINDKIYVSVDLNTGNVTVNSEPIATALLALLSSGRGGA